MTKERNEDTSGRAGRPWGVYNLSEESPVTVVLGPQVIWLRLRDGEVWLAHAPRDPSATQRGERSPVPPPDDPSWERWATAGRVSRVELKPVLSSRPVVLQPERTFRLTRGAGARVYVRLPVWIRVQLPGDPPVVLDELPSMTMSDTWWGDPMRGELAYWLPTTARREMRPELFLPHVAVCPLQMWNRSAGDLRVERVLLKVEYLSLFEEAPGRLWTDVSTLRYEGEMEESVVEKSGTPPEEAPAARPICPPRLSAPKGLRAWSFDRIRAGFGMAP